MTDRIDKRWEDVKQSVRNSDNLQCLHGTQRQFHLWILLDQSQGSIQVTTYEQASRYPHPESFVAPAGFALEGLSYAKRFYKKTASGRACDGKQELHNVRRSAAPQR